MKRKIDPDVEYDQRIDRIVQAQSECPYFERHEVEVEQGDTKFCTYDKKPCEHRRHCPNGKW